MAKVELFVPLVIRFETGTVNAKMTNGQLFDKARKTGYANDQADLGGATMCGITLTTYKAYCQSKNRPKPTAEQLKHITFTDWLAILKTMFWDKWQADKIKSQSVAEMLVDFVWTSGSYGIMIPQKALGVKTDGIVGSATLAAVNRMNPEKLFAELKKERLSFVDRICVSRPANRKFRQGWINRINAIKFKP